MAGRNAERRNARGESAGGESAGGKGRASLSGTSRGDIGVRRIATPGRATPKKAPSTSEGSDSKTIRRSGTQEGRTKGRHLESSGVGSGRGAGGTRSAVARSVKATEDGAKGRVRPRPERTTRSAGVKVGAPAPPFELHDQNDEVVSNDSLVGQPYVLYFYPKDNTP